MKTSSLLLLHIFPIVLYSQNLVQNPSFENYSFCPTSPGQISRANFWSSFSVSNVEYFNACAPSCHATSCPGVPENYRGNCIPYDGNACTGVLIYGIVTDMNGNIIPVPNYRQYLGTYLINSLITGHKYFASAYIHKGTAIAGTGGFPPYTSSSSGICNNFCFRFFTTPYDQNNPVPIDNFAQIRNTSLITDTGWVKIAGSFIADSAYSYFAMGNFFNDSLTDTLNIVSGIIGTGGGESAAYYYVDYVCVSEDSLWQATTGISEVPEKLITIFPNPTTGLMQIANYPFSKIKIFNPIGQFVMERNLEQNFIIDVSALTSGLYIFRTEDSWAKFIKQ